MSERGMAEMGGSEVQSAFSQGWRRRARARNVVTSRGHIHPSSHSLLWEAFNRHKQRVRLPATPCRATSGETLMMTPSLVAALIRVWRFGLAPTRVESGTRRRVGRDGERGEEGEGEKSGQTWTQ